MASKKDKSTNLPESLKQGIEESSGLKTDDVKVHYSAARPVQLNARDYAEGNKIHSASGQEKHLPHESWHTVQQKQGKVKVTVQLNTDVVIDDNQSLEKAADHFGHEAMKKH